MNDVLAALQAFYGEALARLLRHQATARLIRQYDANNTYQYIINREETHLSWIGSAIVELGGRLEEQPAEHELATGHAQGERGGGDNSRQAIEADARDAAAFVERWRPRIATLPNARHAKLLNVILGEVLEQQRFFEQAFAGRTDLLGRRGEQLEPARGDVLPSRWIE